MATDDRREPVPPSFRHAVTWMSRSAPARGQGDTANRHSIAISWGRHAACIAALSGCLYIEPIVQPPENSPPELILPSPDQAREVIPFALSRLERNIIVIVARDADSDPLDMVWSMGAFDPNDYESFVARAQSQTTFTIELPRDDELDGVLLDVRVFDHLEVTQLTFRLEVQ